MTLILSSPLPLSGIQALARRNLQKWRGGAPLSHLPFLLPFPPLVCREYGNGIRRKGVKCLFKCWWFPLLPVIVSLVNSNGLKTFPEGQTSKCHFIWWNTRASSLRSILRAFSLPNCFAALTPISHIPPIPSCCGLFRFRQPARPPAWGAGYTTHVQVASVEFAGPMEHLFILTQNKCGDSKENGHISDLTSLPSSFSLHPNDRN